MTGAALRGRILPFINRHLSGEALDARQVFSIIVPILIDQAFVVGLNLLNTAMISSSGVAAISAVSMIDSLNIFMLSVLIAVSTGGTVIVAQNKGSGNDAMVSRATAASILAVTLLAAGVSVILIVVNGPLLRLLFGAAEADVFSNGRTYLLFSCASFSGFAVTEASCGALRGVGKARSSLVLSLTRNLSYVVLNLTFIVLFKMGVTGLGLATVISRYLSAAFALFFLIRMDSSLGFKLRDTLRVRFDTLRRIFTVGLPFAVEQMFFNGGKILTQTFIVGLGTYAMATNAITGSMAMLLQIPGGALSLAVVTVVGQSMGAGNVRDARKFIRSFLWLSSGSLFVMGLIILPFFRPLAGLFHPPEEIVGTIFTILVINIGALVPLWSMSFILPAALRAAGDARFTSVVAMITMWTVRVVLGYVLGVVLQLGILGVWLAMNIEWGVRAFIFMLRFKGDKWCRHCLIE